MSFDPNVPPDPPPPPPSSPYPQHAQPPHPRPPSWAEGGPLPVSMIRERVLMPAVFLLAVVVLNLLLSLGLFGAGFFYSQLPADKMEEQMARDNPHQLNQIKQAGWTVQDVLNVGSYVGYGGGCAALGTALVCVPGAICMLLMRGYGLAIFSAVLVSIPCISPIACPCLFIGTGIGVWCLVVLLSPDVREAFR